MNHHEFAIADCYDHEQEPAPASRDREAPDWGGDELFTSTPGRRRFERPVRGEHVPGRFEPARLRDTAEHPVQRPAARLAAIQAQPSHPLELPPALDPGPTALKRAPQPVGRRTVTITGHPDRLPARRRPAPTLDERIVGSRPDRVAAYAFALGLVLILVAFLSAT
jgi:hypothetical protein